MPQFTCAIEGCEATKHEAKGMCRLHYRRTLKRTPDKPKLETCLVCGTQVERHSGGGRKYGRTCSNECKRRLTFGWSEPLPDMHWARMYGATCEWKAPVIKTATAKPARFTAGRCKDCDSPFIAETYGSTIDYCSSQCGRRASHRKRRAREYGSPGSFTHTDIMRLYHQAGRRCAYCRQPVIGLPESEHVLALSRGGHNDLSNLLAACHLCNSDKGDMTLTEWAKSRQTRGLAPVFTDVYSFAPGYKHLVEREATGTAWRLQHAA